jgi:hypothetical protein
VLIIDETNQISNCIPTPSKQPEPIHYKGVDYVSRNNNKFGSELNSDDAMFQQYDFILILTDIRDAVANKEKLRVEQDYPMLMQNLKNTFIITDSKRNHMEGTVEFINHYNKAVSVIIRDICDSKLNMEYYINTYFDKQLITKRYSLPLDEVDYEYRIRIEYEGFQEFRNISKEYQALLIHIINEMVEADEKEVKKAFQRAKKGVVHESGIF